MMASTESTTLQNCIKELELSLKVNLKDITIFLHQKNILLKATYDSLTDTMEPEEKAHKVFHALQDKVEADKAVYKIFMEYLHKKSQYKMIMETLEREYMKLDPKAAPATSKSDHSNAAYDVPIKSRHMQLIKWRGQKGEERKLMLQQTLAIHWIKVAEEIGLTTIRLIERTHMKDPQDCLRDVMARWMKNAKRMKYPCTWRGLCQLLDDMEIIEVNKDLKEVLAANFSDIKDNFETSGTRDKRINSRHMQLIKWRSQEGEARKLRLNEMLAVHWIKVAKGIGLTTIRLIESIQGKDDTNCLRDVMETWMENAPIMKYQCTCRGLCQLLDDLEISDVNKDLKEVLEANFSDITENF